MSEPGPCSERWRQAGMPLFGTAAQTDLWLLIEYAGLWSKKALADNDLPAAVVERLAQLPLEVEAAHGRSLRIQFIKQPASRQRGRPQCMLADAATASGHLVASNLESYGALVDLRAEDLAEGRLRGGRAVDEDLVLVCTNGKRDLCCAKFGLPVYTALLARFGERVWQTTHLGGHRFAPTLAYLPAGIVYGFVAQQEAVPVIEALDAGKLSLAHLRGRAAYPPLAQAAEYFLRSHRQDVGLEGLQLAAVREDADGARVTFVDRQQSEVHVALRVQHDATPAVQSCGAAPKPVARFEVLSIADAVSN